MVASSSNKALGEPPQLMVFTEQDERQGQLGPGWFRGQEAAAPSAGSGVYVGHRHPSSSFWGDVKMNMVPIHFRFFRGGILCLFPLDLLLLLSYCSNHSNLQQRTGQKETGW